GCDEPGSSSPQREPPSRGAQVRPTRPGRPGARRKPRSGGRSGEPGAPRGRGRSAPGATVRDVRFSGFRLFSPLCDGSPPVGFRRVGAGTPSPGAIREAEGLPSQDSDERPGGGGASAPSVATLPGTFGPEDAREGGLAVPARSPGAKAA